MSTNSAIGISYQGVIKAIYCHYDGSIGSVGQVLNDHYQDSVKTSKLISLGDISSLGAEIGSQHDFDNCPRGETNCYGRDRGETGVEYITCQSELAYVQDMACRGCEYFYLYKDGQWFVTEGRTFFPLSPLLIKETV